jgi:hypothetical protein
MRHTIRGMGDVIVVSKRAGAILSVGINKYVIFCVL